MVTIEATVDLMTGDLRLSEETQNSVQTLSEQLKLATQSLQNQDADLIRALAS